MPGGRLTQQERQQIALGLAEDLTYAEIARRLDRPTSTVTREVMRNGGPAAYRPDLAQRATERRARRRRPGTPRGPQPHARADGRDAQAVREYEETFTTLFMRQGLPRMASSVLTCLYTSDAGSLTAAELVQRLQVSPASVSKAIALLEVHGLVQRERVDGRRERYVADNQVWYQSMVAAARSNAHIAETARQGAAVLGSRSPAGGRLEKMALFMDFVNESIARAAEEARDVLSTDDPPARGARSRHLSVVIERSPADVYAFAADPDNLPRWAGRLARGEVTVTFTPRNELGVLDHDVTLPSGAVVTHPMRVVPHPRGAEVVFTLRRLDASDAGVERDVATVREELGRLRSLLERDG